MKRDEILNALRLASSQDLARELVSRRSTFAGGRAPLTDGTSEELEARRKKREAQARWRAKVKLGVNA